MDIDQREFELLERQLAERIEKRVRGRLFAIYGTLGAGILAAFTYFGYDIISSIKPGVIEAASERSLAAIDPVLKQAEEAADEAEKLALRNAIELEAMSKFRKDAQLRLNTTLDGVEDVTARIETKLLTLSNELKSAEQDVDAYRQRSTDLFLSASYEATIQEIAENVALLTAAVSGLRTEDRSEEIEQLDVAMAQTTFEAVVERSSASQPGEQTTVYFQFAGVNRDIAEKIAGNIDNTEFTIPGEERLKEAAGKAEVRYFFDEDETKARQLAEEVNRVLTVLKMEAIVEARYVYLAKGSPRQGILELWLEPRPL